MKLLLFLILSLYCLNQYTQVKKIVIVSGIDRLPLAGVTITSKNKSGVVISSDLGAFDPSPFNNTDSLIITHVGYQTLTVARQQVNDTIFLFPTTRTLENVMVRDWSAFEKKSVVGYFYASSNGRWGMIKGSSHASLITGGSTKEEWIKTVMIRFASLSSCNDSFQIRLLTFDKVTKSPGPDLLSKPKVFTMNEASRKVFIDVSDEHLIMPLNGVVAVVEIIGRRADCPVNTHTWLACTMKKVKDHSWLGHQESRWYPDMSHPSDKSMIPCIGLELAQKN